jgi:sphingolipid delta-4 desaturase
MPASRTDFAYSAGPEPHSGRAREGLRRHPEIRALIRPHPASFAWTVGLVALHMAFAALLAQAPWWAVFLVTYVVGAFLTHALGVLIHVVAHRLVFRRPVLNILTGIVANLPLFFPSSSHQSLTRLLGRFLFDPHRSLYFRVLRENRGERL